MTKDNNNILIAAALKMASHLTLFPCLAVICLVPSLYQLWPFSSNIYHLQCSFSFSCAPTHCFAKWPQSPTLSQTATGYKLLQNLSNRTKILHNLPKSKKNIWDSTTWHKNITVFTEGRNSIGSVASPKPNSMTVKGRVGQTFQSKGHSHRSQVSKGRT